MDKKIIIFLMIILSINSMFLVTGLFTKGSSSDTNNSLSSFYSALPSEYQDKVGLGTTNTTLSGGASDIIRDFVQGLPFIGGMFEAATPIFQTIDLAGKLSFGYFDVINRIAEPGTGLNLILFIFLLPIGIIQVIAMGYLFLYILSAVAGFRP